MTETLGLPKRLGDFVRGLEEVAGPAKCGRHALGGPDRKIRIRAGLHRFYRCIEAFRHGGLITMAPAGAPTSAVIPSPRMMRLSVPVAVADTTLVTLVVSGERRSQNLSWLTATETLYSPSDVDRLSSSGCKRSSSAASARRAS